MIKLRKRLVFKLQFAESILSGEKKSTIRVKTNFRVNDIVDIYVGSARVGKAIIRKIVRKKISELNDHDARKDGFKSREDLVRELSKLYGRGIVSRDIDVYIIEFELL